MESTFFDEVAFFFTFFTLITYINNLIYITYNTNIINTVADIIYNTPVAYTTIATNKTILTYTTMVYTIPYFIFPFAILGNHYI